MKRKNYYCNFRAPDLKDYELWQKFKKNAREHGLTTCKLILPFCESAQTLKPMLARRLKMKDLSEYPIKKIGEDATCVEDVLHVVQMEFAPKMSRENDAYDAVSADAFFTTVNLHM